MGRANTKYIELSRLNWRRLVSKQEFGVFLILLLLAGGLSLYTDTFLTSTNIFNILRAFSWIAISAFGQCMVIITGGIDLSVGSVMGLAGLVTGMLLVQGVNVPTAVIAGLLVGLIVGLLNGCLLYTS
ncbi:MAG: ribose ABC transporter permease, partial [Anaerolineae bacterium]|nr:ribose ABC transporter permease [Anaerolineae bacterium]